MISKFNVNRDIVSSFRQDAATGIIYMTIGTAVEHLEIELPAACTDDFIALNTKLEEQKIALVASMAQIQIMMQGHQLAKTLQSMTNPPFGDMKDVKDI
jgi:hypothetical protein